MEKYNKLNMDANGMSPLNTFSDIEDEIKSSDFHTFGCPVFILDAENQSGVLVPQNGNQGLMQEYIWDLLLAMLVL